LAQSGRYATEFQCLLLGVKRTSALATRGLLQLASDLKMAIAELERLERYRVGDPQSRAS
jgi:hypothetical protein